MVGEQIAVNATQQVDYLFNDKPKEGNKSNEEHETAQQAEHVHRFLAKIG